MILHKFNCSNIYYFNLARGSPCVATAEEIYCKRLLKHSLIELVKITALSYMNKFNNLNQTASNFLYLIRLFMRRK
jgi:hypothetical protein